MTESSATYKSPALRILIGITWAAGLLLGIAAEAATYYWQDDSGNRCRSGRNGGWLWPRSAWALLFLGLGLAASPTGPAHAAIAFDFKNSTDTGETQSTTLTWTHTVSGANRFLVLAVIHKTGKSITSITYDGVALTQIRTDTDGTDIITSLWRLDSEPPTGTRTAEVIMNGALRFAAGSISLTGVDQTNPIDAQNGTSGTGDPASVSVTTIADSAWIIDVVGGKKTDFGAPASGQVEQWKVSITDARGGQSTKGPVTPAGATTMSWPEIVAPTKAWAISAVSLKPAAVALPSLSIVKSTLTLEDPVSGTTDPKAIPGAIKRYLIEVTNTGSEPADADTVFITDSLPTFMALRVIDFDGVNPGPVAFVDGSPASGLSYTFTSLVSITDDIEFSNDGGTTWTYPPVASGDGTDPAVTDIRINPKGIFASNTGSGDPSFQVRFKAVIQ